VVLEKIINVRGSIRKLTYFYLQNKNNYRKKCFV